MDRLKALIKNKLTEEVVLYLVFGVMTTAVSIFTFWLFTSVFDIHYITANALSWIIAVTFAFFTNKFYVFKSVKRVPSVFFRELLLFFTARLLSLAVEEAGLFLLIDIIGTTEMLAKIVLQVVVVVLNYVFSKLIVFRKSKEGC